MKLIWFDFHHECRKMKWENLSRLLNLMSDNFQLKEYLHLTITNNNVNFIISFKRKFIFDLIFLYCLNKRIEFL